MNAKDICGVITRNNINFSEKVCITYKNGRGHFSFNFRNIFDFTIKDFRKIVVLIEDSEEPRMIAGYINSKLKACYAEATQIAEDRKKFANSEEDKRIIKFLEDYTKKIKRFHEVLSKNIEIAPLVSDKDFEQLKSQSNLEYLEKCTVKRITPININPIKFETSQHNGYKFTYRGLPLQTYKDDKRIYIIDPVLGLPITNFEGNFSQIEEKLSGIFFNYLKTLENNKEAIVQIAKAFKAA